MNGMEISDELIGCYIEGTCSADELKVVRNYLIKNPYEYERIISLMDNQRNAQIKSIDQNSNNGASTHYLDFSFASAAFVPFKAIKSNSPVKDCMAITYKNLNNLLDEIDTL